MRKTPSSAQADLFTLVMEQPIKSAAARRTPKTQAAPVPKAVAMPKVIIAPKVAPLKAAKTISVKAAAPAPPAPVRVIAEMTGASGRAWRMSSRHAVAYVKDAALAGELLATDTKHLAKSAMAVYYDRKGKAFAWQVRFDAARWDEVVGRLG